MILTFFGNGFRKSLRSSTLEVSSWHALLRRFGRLRAIRRQRCAKTSRPLYPVRESQGSHFILDPWVALHERLLGPASRGVLPPVPICAVALGGGYVYGSMSLEAASFLGKGSADLSSSSSWGRAFRLPSRRWAGARRII